MKSQDIHVFEKVYAAIKNYCKEDPWKTDCFDIIAKSAGLPMESLELYLDLLNDFGLIKYSLAEQYIYLTKDGRNVDIEIRD
jgi:hypothetical protein